MPGDKTRGWTVLAFWDRSVDSRPASNSVFIAKLIWSFEDMVTMARTNFPEVWARFHFEVVPAR